MTIERINELSTDDMIRACKHILGTLSAQAVARVADSWQGRTDGFPSDNRLEDALEAFDQIVEDNSNDKDQYQRMTVQGLMADVLEAAATCYDGPLRKEYDFQPDLSDEDEPDNTKPSFPF